MLTQSVSAHHVRAVLLAAQRRGLDTGPLLARAGLPATLAEELPSPERASERSPAEWGSVGRVPSERVSAERFGQLVRMLWAALDDELIGFGGA
ncbi:hypothetical protein GTW71_24935, partial [Streptomyces sp. SID6041]|nr:hypothetical protein [Streptomyces sp. SID6041]